MNRSFPTTFAILVALACFLASGAAPADVFNLGSGLTSLELVTVGDAGKGGVNYDFLIGKYEVTAAQYTVFLNAVAKADPYGLYHEGMRVGSSAEGSRYGCNIIQSGSAGNYAYSVVAGYENRPVNFVSWGDAARFVNWLHNGQPTGPQDASTTEDGAYTLNGKTGAALVGIQRNPNALYWIPTAAEWTKAGYYDPSAGHFWNFPYGSNKNPKNALSPVGDRHANFGAVFSDGWLPVQGDHYTTEVGFFQGSSSPYGTFDQGGNVWEWVDEPSAYMRGGAFMSSSGELTSTSKMYDQYYGEAGHCWMYGFRIAGVPEPGGVGALIGMAAVGFVWFWRRR